MSAHMGDITETRSTRNEGDWRQHPAPPPRSSHQRAGCCPRPEWVSSQTSEVFERRCTSISLRARCQRASPKPCFTPAESPPSLQLKAYLRSLNRSIRGLPPMLGLFGYVLDFHRPSSKMFKATPREHDKREGRVSRAHPEEISSRHGETFAKNKERERRRTEA